MFQRADDGFSLVEVLIAMFLLAVLSLAVLPLIITVTSVSVSNRDLSEATAFAQAQLAPIRDAFPVNPLTPASCDHLASFADTGVVGPADLTADIVIGACPTTFPATVTVKITVQDPGGVLVTLPTRILVGKI